MNIKTSLVGLVLLLSVGLTAAVNASEKKLEPICSQYTNGGGVIATPTQFACSVGPKVCCYRIPDNFVYTRP